MLMSQINQLSSQILKLKVEGNKDFDDPEGDFEGKNICLSCCS